MDHDLAYRSYPRRLPIVTLKGKRYFADSRLRQFRNVENPHDFIEFNEMELECLRKLLGQ